MLLWDNNRVQIINRDRLTNTFEFPSSFVSGKHVYDLFNEEEYKQLLQWRQN